ncbi:hypothetical protein RHGRI_037142 [Rhododendron griersonianum]|uniref:Uncharacterized protein n=1 Tax=Rhododendron griersonianum TaxID=479676 RepID=A0AAV6HTV1_9ERIC|nr:hypothetical protein RHGRI_037142 [Rhododendron griersonianum]
MIDLTSHSPRFFLSVLVDLTIDAAIPSLHIKAKENMSIIAICKKTLAFPVIKMEEKMKHSSTTTALFILLLITVWIMSSPALGCASDGSQCRNCILDRFKYDCPPCVPILRCMSRCLWGGSARAKCVKKCDCNRGYPRLSDCKKCMSECKCSCAQA